MQTKSSRPTYQIEACRHCGGSFVAQSPNPARCAVCRRSWPVLPPFPDDGRVWLPVVGYEGLYQVSDDGKLRRIDRVGRKRGQFLVSFYNESGYEIVSLSSAGKMQTNTVHRIVAPAFLGPCPDGHEVNHRDGDKRNNRTSNLEYVTTSANLAHAYAHGLREPWQRKREQQQPVL